MANNASMRATLTHLLSNVRDGKEIRTYLEKFGAAEEGQFAVIKLGGAILEKELEAAAEGLALLNSLGLRPVVIHGVGPQFDAALAERGIECPKINGLRTTPFEVLGLLSALSSAWTMKLVAAIQRSGASAVPMPPSVIAAQYVDKDKLGAVGDPIALALDQIHEIVEAGAIPILSCLGQAEGGQVVNINADAIVRSVALDLEPIKIVFVTGTGGVLDQSGEVINAINLAMDYEDLEASDWVNEGMMLKITEIKSLLDQLPASSSVSITSVSGLVRELFTHGGAGTLLRKGERFKTFEAREGVDWKRLTGLVEGAFKRPLRPDYWENAAFRRAYVADSYRCAAVLTEVDGAVVLDKFAVAPEARGEGLSRTLWRLLTEDEPVFYWRSRSQNPFNAFYMKEADGFMRRGEWNLFWVSSGAPVDMNILDRVMAAPDSFAGQRSA